MSHKPLLCIHSWIRNTFIFPTHFGPFSQHQGYHLITQEGQRDNYIFHYNQICVDKSSLNFCLTFPKLVWKYSIMWNRHISCFHWHSLHLYWHATIIWWCLTETALYETGILAWHILNMQYVILTACSHFKPRHAYFIQYPTVFLTSYNSLKLLKTSWRSASLLN